MTDSPRNPPDAGEVPIRRNRMLPDRPPKLTGADLEARFTSWTGTTRLKVVPTTPEARGSLLRKVAAGALVAGLAACALVLTGSGDAHVAAEAVNSVRIAELETQIKAAGVPVDPDALTSALTALGRIAYDEAVAVADKQQVFAQLYHNAHLEPDPLNGAPGAADEAIARHRQTLEPYFAPPLLKVDNDTAYTFSTANGVEPDEVDPRYEWFIGYRDRAPLDPAAYRWSVESALPGNDPKDGVEVIWTAKDAAGTVLAWANGHFSGRDGVFDALTVTVTADGQALLPEGAPNKLNTVPDLLALDGGQ